jgi:hypothetical protein
MRLLAIIGTTGLFLLLGSSSAYAAQDRQEPDPKPEAKPEAKPGKQEPQDKAAKPEAKPGKQEPQDKPAKPEAKETAKPPVKQEQGEKPAEKQPQQQVQQSKGGDGKSGGAHGRISEAHYSASFGDQHHFHVNQGDYNHHRFAYGGYSFGFIEPWPVGWYYTDEVYVVYDDGGYYMYDVVHPGVRISVSIL